MFVYMLGRSNDNIFYRQLDKRLFMSLMNIFKSNGHMYKVQTLIINVYQNMEHRMIYSKLDQLMINAYVEVNVLEYTDEKHNMIEVRKVKTSTKQLTELDFPLVCKEDYHYSSKRKQRQFSFKSFNDISFDVTHVDFDITSNTITITSKSKHGPDILLKYILENI